MLPRDWKLPDESGFFVGREYEVTWDGQGLSTNPYLAVDTETEVVDLTKEVPRLAVMSVTNGRRTVLVHPFEVPHFINAHAGAAWVMHNAAFDWAVIRKALEDYFPPHFAASDALREWRDALDQGRVRDTMLLDFLVRLADPAAVVTHLRNLGELARDYLQTEVDKNDPYRMRYAELIGADWREVEESGFWEYAARDVMATHALYAQLHGLAAQRSRDFVACRKSYGPLTETLQVKAAVVLAEVGRNGFALDYAKVAEARARLKGEIDAASLELERLAGKGILRRYRVKTREAAAGDLMLNKKTGVPRLVEPALRTALEGAARDAGLDLARMPRTQKTRELSTALDPWKESAGHHPLVATWAQMAEKAKLHQFLVQLGNQGDAVHAQYQPLVRTGRTSCRAPNVQNIPRVAWMRELFVARPGHKLVIVDYSAIELVTLAAVLLDRYGESVLASTIASGRDPHAYTAALFQGLEYEDFVARLKDEKAEVRRAESEGRDRPATPFAQARQAAKAVNFGVPGGLGADKLAAYARANYGVALTPVEAKNFRERLTTVIYPELEKYLSDDTLVRLAGNLHTPPHEVAAVASRHLGRPPFDGYWFLLDKVVGGETRTRQGKEISLHLRSAIWNALSELTNGTRLYRAVRDQKAGAWLHRQLLGNTAVTLTGRVRAGLSYTEARNTPFQGLAADGAKLALYRLWKEGHRIVAFVHDEIVVEVPEARAKEAQVEIERIMVEEMAGAIHYPVPVKVEGQITERWKKG